jgi:DNA-binding FadR family transcriptional regulator
MTTSPDRVRVPKTAELVATRIRQRIVTGELGEGDALPQEAALMELFGVSRPTLREAFRVLENEGLIRVRRGSRGTAVVQLPTDQVVARYAGLVLEHKRATIRDVSAIRSLLESACVELLATRSEPSTVAALREAVEHAAQLADADEQLAAQNAFHSLVVRLLGNQTVVLLHNAVQLIATEATNRRASILRTDADTARHAGAQAHRRVVDLIEAGDVPGALTLWRRHIDQTTEYLVGEGGPQLVLDLWEPGSPSR